MKLNVRQALLTGLCLALPGCAVGPDYVRPETPAPAQYKELGDWKVSEPADDKPRGAWWEVFHDDKLNELIQAADAANQTVVQAEASYRQAMALVGGARAAYFPTVTGNAASTREHVNQVGAPQVATVDTVTLGATWEPDLWGAVRRNVEENVANAASSYATLGNTRLSIESTLATDYFQLRGLDAQAKLLTETVDAYQKALQLTKNQYQVGVAQLSDVVQAQTQLVSTQAQLVNVGVQRSQLEHAIAVLTGKAPSELSLAPLPLTVAQIVPPTPVGVPSSLLERRPDVAAAERKVAAANAQIGVATAAYFPQLTLAASGGYQSEGLAHWISLPNRIWSIGPALAETIFDGGLRESQVSSARAAYDQAVASYRQTVLTAFQGVEDDLAALQILEREDALQLEAVRLAQKAVDLQINRYKAGTIAYTDVITSQTTLLTNQETEVTLLSQRVTYCVSLIAALGGNWDEQRKQAPVELGVNDR